MIVRVSRSLSVLSVLSVLFASVACVAIGACARERVEIADLEGEPAKASQPPGFGPADSAPPGVSDAGIDGADAATNCSFAAPPITACAPCPSGYLVDDAGRPTCDCCE
jgi:hypothetical protein